jgi:hypothetical protein
MKFQNGNSVLSTENTKFKKIKKFSQIEYSKILLKNDLNLLQTTDNSKLVAAIYFKITDTTIFVYTLYRLRMQCLPSHMYMNFTTPTIISSF